MVVVFVHHHADGHGRTVARALVYHGEQDTFFFHHVAQQFVLNRLHQRDEIFGKAVGVHFGHFFAQLQHFGHLAAVGVVIAGDDVGGDVVQRGVLPDAQVGHGCVPFLSCCLKMRIIGMFCRRGKQREAV